MGITEDLADQLARDTVAAVDRTGDDTIVAQVGKILAASSVAASEAYLSAIRVIQAERRARKFLEERLAQDSPPSGGGTG